MLICAVRSEETNIYDGFMFLFAFLKRSDYNLILKNSSIWVVLDRFRGLSSPRGFSPLFTVNFGQFRKRGFLSYSCVKCIAL